MGEWTHFFNRRQNKKRQLKGLILFFRLFNTIMFHPLPLAQQSSLAFFRFLEIVKHFLQNFIALKTFVQFQMCAILRGSETTFSAWSSANKDLVTPLNKQLFAENLKLFAEENSNLNKRKAKTTTFFSGVPLPPF